MINFGLPRLDKDQKLREMFSKYCRLKKGDIWVDEEKKHKIGCLDILDKDALIKTLDGEKPTLAIHDPPYNLVAFKTRKVEEFIGWCKEWIDFTNEILTDDASLYIWLGADQKKHFEPFPEFILMMKETAFESKSFITMRNQRGYGTQKNWMAIRQELLYYAKGKPVFNTKDVYTEIPKVVQGYYKEINGIKTENLERSKSNNIRAGNVWVDVQQVFHLLQENVNGCFAQKPLKSIERIINVSSKEDDLVVDFFAHAGSTLIASELHNRRCFTIDIEPVFCEISIRRLERLRETGKPGWQNSNPFAGEIRKDKEIREYLINNYNLNIPEL
ncbi:MAG: site-specific DNA-methyltransferase [Melioribacteraceae bacterium]|nr:site-specific DNA-methyltransferase [Melioribacteraceae bacterium]